MPVKVTCPSCGRGGRVPDEAADRDILCPACGQQFRAPAPASAPSESKARPAADRSTVLAAALAVSGGLVLILAAVVVALVVRGGDRADTALLPASLLPTANAAPPASTTSPPLPSAPAAGDDDDAVPISTAEIVARSEPSVALVKGRMSSGTGFLVLPGVLVTNAHVIADELPTDLEVRFPSAPDGRRGPFPAALLAEDKRRDLAFLAVQTNLPPLRVARKARYRKGEDITVIGNPGVGGEMILENAVSRGVMSVRARIDGQEFVQLGVAINPGNSGGPVFDARGLVVGVATLKTAKEEALAFCIPVEDLNAAIARVAAQPRTAAAEALSRRRAPLVLKRLTEAGAVQAVGLDLARRAWERDPYGPLTLDDAANADIKKRLNTLDDLDRRAFANLRAEAAQVAADAGQSEDVRRDMARLADNYGAMKDLLARPGPSLEDFRRRASGSKRAHLRLVEALSSMMREPVPDALLAALGESGGGNDPIALLDSAAPPGRPGLPSYREWFDLGPPGLPPIPFPRHLGPRGPLGRPRYR